MKLLQRGRKLIHLRGILVEGGIFVLCYGNIVVLFPVLEIKIVLFFVLEKYYVIKIKYFIHLIQD